MLNFPKDPENGTIFELGPGLYYIYDSSMNSWTRVQGAMPGPATPLSDGLMSADDLYKLNRLVLPPPNSSLTTDDTITTLTSGIIGLKEGDEFITIDDTGPMMNVGADIGEDEAIHAGRQLHQHTYSFDISIDTVSLFDYMVRSGKFVVRSEKGPQGALGDQGLDGEDKVPHGEAGVQGLPGSNTSFDLELQSENASFERKSLSHRAIVSIDTEEISKDENYLVITRANVGNPDACPPIIRLTDTIESPWVAAVAESSDDINRSWSPSECLICTGELYYLNISHIIEVIEAEFSREIVAIKHDMEQIVSFWLTIMSGLFDEQKAALCCALEYCKSQTRNTETRRYIERQRIQAAQTQTITKGTTGGIVTNFDSAGHSLVIDGDPFNSGRSTVVDTVMDPACEPGGFGGDNKFNMPNNADPIGGSQCVPGVAVVNGQSITYDECPPGYMPRSVFREKYQGVPFTVSSPSYLTDYTPSPSPQYNPVPPPVGTTLPAKPGVPYIHPSSTIVSPPVEAGLTSDPTFEASLSVTIDAIERYRDAVPVKIFSADGSQALASGRTDKVGVVVFRGLTSARKYRVILEPEDATVYDPNGWNNISLTPGRTTALVTEVDEGKIAVGTSTGPDIECGSGTNRLSVTVNGSKKALEEVYVRIYRSDNNAFVCGGQVNPDTGALNFVGLGSIEVYGRLTSTTGSFSAPPNCYNQTKGQQTGEVNYPCPRAILSGQNVVDVEMAFDENVMQPTSIGAVEIITQDDERYQPFVAEQKRRLSTVQHVKTPVEIQQFVAKDNEYMVGLANGLGIPPDRSQIIGRTKQSRLNNSLVNHYNHEFSDGIYTLCLTNESDSIDGFMLTIATQNAKFIQGYGSGWSDRFVKLQYVDPFGNEFAQNTVISCNRGPDSGSHWWIQFRVVAPKDVLLPYASDCGAFGPAPSVVDKRLCRELPTGSGDPMLRKFEPDGTGRLREWTTSKCGTEILPDALQLKCSKLLDDVVILCRTVDGNYTGGLNHNGSSYQFLIEQIDPVTTPHPPTHLVPVVQKSAAGDGGTRFKCTVLLWDVNDCSGNVDSFSSIVANASCKPFSLSSKWDFNDAEFTVTKIDNKYSDAGFSELFSDLVLELDGKSLSQHKTVTGNLAKGDYIADIVGCCVKAGNQYIGHVEVEYQILDGSYVKRFPNLGASDNELATSSAYRGLVLEIEHAGGPVSIRLVTPVADAGGSIAIRFTRKENSASSPRTTIPTRVSDGCQVQSGYLRWYVDSWATNDCDGIVVTVAGQDYIVVHKSGSSVCQKYIDPSLAWPTLDGNTFVQLPQTGAVTFKRNVGLESAIIDAINRRRYDKAIGDPSTIGIILFPTIQ